MNCSRSHRKFVFEQGTEPMFSESQAHVLSIRPRSLVGVILRQTQVCDSSWEGIGPPFLCMLLFIFTGRTSLIWPSSPLCMPNGHIKNLCSRYLELLDTQHVYSFNSQVFLSCICPFSDMKGHRAVSEPFRTGLPLRSHYLCFRLHDHSCCHCTVTIPDSMRCPVCFVCLLAV